MTKRKAVKFACHYALYRLRRAVRLGRSDTEGVAALEFALILPIMLMLYIGTAELTTGLMANRKMTLVARVVSDLIAQEDDEANGVNNTTLDNVYASAGKIMSPFTTSTLKITASSIKFVPKSGAPANNPQYKAMTVWSISDVGGTKRPCGENAITKVANDIKPTSTTMPTGLYGSGAVIVADVEYTHGPNFGGSFIKLYNGTNSITMKHTSYMKPRTQTEIKYTESTVHTKMTVCNPAPPSAY